MMDNTTASCNHCKSSLNNTETDFVKCYSPANSKSSIIAA